MKVRVKKKEKKRDRIVSGLSIIGFYSNRSFTLRIMVLKTCCTQVVYFLASTYVVCVRTQECCTTEFQIKYFIKTIQ